MSMSFLRHLHSHPNQCRTLAVSMPQPLSISAAQETHRSRSTENIAGKDDLDLESLLWDGRIAMNFRDRRIALVHAAAPR